MKGVALVHCLHGPTGVVVAVVVVAVDYAIVERFGKSDQLRQY